MTSVTQAEADAALRAMTPIQRATVKTLMTQLPGHLARGLDAAAVPQMVDGIFWDADSGCTHAGMCGDGCVCGCHQPVHRR